MPGCTCATNSSLTCGVCHIETGSPLKLTNNFSKLIDAADTEDEMLTALNKIAHRVRMGPKPHQRRTEMGPTCHWPKRLTKRQLDWIGGQVQEGKIDLPDIDQLEDEDHALVRALADSGSAAHVANACKPFSGAAVRESDARRRGAHYSGAGGDQIPNQGEAVV